MAQVVAKFPLAQSTIIHSASLILNLSSTATRLHSFWTSIARLFRSWLDAGKSMAPNVGKMWRFRASDLNAWLDCQERAS
jgi:hypothetical protein